jgi:hypothetical protein
MLEPRTARAGRLGSSVDVLDFHVGSPFLWGNE